CEANAVAAALLQPERNAHRLLVAGDDRPLVGELLPVLGEQIELPLLELAVGGDVQLDLGAAVVLQLAVAALDALDLVADIGPLAVGGGEAVAVNQRRRADIDAEDVGRGIATNDTIVEALLDLEVRNGNRPLAVTLRFEPALLLGVSLRRPGDELQFVG